MRNELEQSVLFIYLNKHAFNGLCRYNSKGLFINRYDQRYYARTTENKLLLAQLAEKAKVKNEL